MVQKDIGLLIGETASGKTAYIEKNLLFSNTNIINCDSRQIYKFLNIGTAKPSEELLKSIKHHLIDIKEINEDFSGGEFFRLVKNIIKKNNDIIISAGTPFYLNILLNGIDDIPQVDKQTRDKVDSIYKDKGIEYLYYQLQDIDPKRAAELSSNDTQRIKRAMEIYIYTGKPISSFFKNRKKINLNIKKIIYIKKDKEVLRRDVFIRIRKMWDMGFVEEVKMLIDKYSEETLYNKKIIGYNEIINYLNNKYNKEEAISKIGKNTLMYIKRQKTFFNKILKPYNSMINFVELKR